MKYIITESQLNIIMEYSDKYGDYKKRWIKVSNYGDLYVKDPMRFVVYLFPNEKGFLVELYYENDLVGQFHCYLDEEEGIMNDVEIDPKFRGLGLGKVLLLKAIDVSYIYLDYFQSDVRGLTSDQDNVYLSLVKNGVLDSNYNIDYDKAQDLIDSVISKMD